MTERYIVEAVLTATDNGYSATLKRASGALDSLNNKLPAASNSIDQTSNHMLSASNNTKTFKDSMLGMATAIGVTTLIAKGFDLIKSSVGSAMGRIDTFDQFGRAMERMTGSSEEASKALDKTNNIVLGTAYGLDVAAKGVQDFVTRGMTVNQATKTIEAWGDAVAFYGKGTNEQLATVTDAIGKMVTKGTVGMDQLNRLFDAGIDAVGIYAQATGRSSTEVQDALSKGEIKAQDFVDTVTTAMMEGTNGVTKIAGAAKEAGASWEGSLANMRAAVTRGVQAIITEVEDARSSADLPGMKDTVTNFGRSTEKVLKGVGKVAGFAAKHFEDLSVVVGILVGRKVAGAFTTSFGKMQNSLQVTSSYTKMLLGDKTKSIAVSALYQRAMDNETMQETMRAAAKKLNIALEQTDASGKVQSIALSSAQQMAILGETGALSAKAIVHGVLTGAISVTTAAQYAWNAALAANPIGAVIVLAGALAIAMKKVTDAQNNSNEEFNKTREKAGQAATAMNETAGAADNLSASYQSNLGEARANAEEQTRLIDELEQLQNSSMGTADKQKAMAAAVQHLNEKYPELNVQLDETGTALDTHPDKYREVINAQEELAKSNALEEYRDELLRTQAVAEFQLETYSALLVQMVNDGSAFERHWLTGGPKVNKQAQELMDSYNDLAESLGLNTIEIEMLTEQLEEEQDAAQGAQEVLDQHAQKLDVLTKKYGDAVDEVVAYSDRTGESYEEIEAQLDSLSEKYDMTAEEIISVTESQGLTLDEVGEKILDYADKYDMSAEEIIAAADAMEVSVEEWADIHEEQLKRAEEALKSATDIAKEHIEATTSGFKVLEQETAISLDQYIANLEKNAAATNQWSTNVNALMRAGVSEGLIRELEKMGPAGAAQAQSFLDELTLLNGGTLGSFDELNESARGKLEELETAFGTGMDAAAEAAKTSIDAQDYVALGTKPPEDIAKGILEGKSAVEAASKEIVDTSTDAITSQATSNQGKLKSQGQKDIKVYTDGLEQGAGKVDLSNLEASVRGSFDRIKSDAQSKSQDTSRVVTSEYQNLRSRLISEMETTRSQIASRWDQIQSHTSSKSSATRETAVSAFNNLQSEVSAAMRNAATNVRNSGSAMSSGLSSTSGVVIAVSRNISSGVISAFSGLPSAMRSSGYYAGMGFYNGLSSTAGTIYRLANNIGANVAATINRSLKIKSPSDVTTWSGEMTGLGIVKGMESKRKAVMAEAERLALAAVPNMSRIDSLNGMASNYNASFSVAPMPLEIVLKLGEKAYRGFAADINSTINQELELKEEYG